MSVTYNPSKPWPLPVLAKFLEVRDYAGYHEIYQKGYVGTGDYEIKLSKMGPIVDYWTCRVFMLRVDMINTAAMHLICNNYYYSKVEINKDHEDNIVSIQNNNTSVTTEVLVSNVKEGDIFSFGLRLIKPDTLVGCANDVWGPKTVQGTIKPASYTFKIWQGTHVLLSMHITQEGAPEVRNYEYLPPAVLNKQLSEQPPGSSMIASLVYYDPQKELKIGVQIGSENIYINYGKRADLPTNSKIYAFIRNTAEAYAVSTNFEPGPKQIARKKEDSKYIKFVYERGLLLNNITQYIFWEK